MKWLEIIVSVDSKYVELVSDIFYTLDVSGIQIDEGIKPSNSDNLFWDYFDEKDIDENAESKVSAYFSSLDDFASKLAFIQEKTRELKERINDIGTCEISIKEHMQEEWETSWKQYFKPVKITEKIVVKPQWEEYETQNDEIIINIDPGMAFGTGTHETTSMCINAIEKNIESRKNVLDIGTGSGILSIAGVLLGLENAVGVDLDAVAVKVANENIQLNNVADRISIYKGDLVETISGKFDMVVANIIADAILILLDLDIQKFMTEKAVFICSGIILEKEQDIIDKLYKQGFAIKNIQRQGEWVCITSTLKNG